MSDSGSEPRRQPLNSLATKIILFVFISTFATAIVVSGTSIQSTHDSVRGILNRLYPLALDHAVRDLEPWLDVAQREVEAIAADDRLRSGHITKERLTAALESSETLDGLMAIAADGVVVASVGSASRLTPPALVPAGHAALHTLDPSEASDSAGALWAAFPVDSADPGIAGVGGVLGVLDRAQILEHMVSELPDEGSSLSLVDSEGRILVSTAARHRSTVALTAPGAGREIREYDADGQRVVGVLRALEPAGGYLLVESPFESAFEPLLSVVSRVFVTDLCIIALFSLLAYRVTATVVRPIERLSEGARRIAQGQIDLEIPESNTRDEVGLLTRTFNDMMQQLRRNQGEIETANRHLTDRNARLQQANEVLSQLSITDGLTKLHNHRFFQDHLTREIKRVSRTREPLAMLMIDIDDFKRLNDRFGHAAGDELLSRLARVLNSVVRETDFLARYGGEEFVILSSGTDIEGGQLLAEKIRTAISEASFILDDSMRPQRMTVSIGVAQFRGNRKQFFAAADQALYRAKDAGKDCVVIDEGLAA